MAKLLQADGVHLGQSDMPVPEARKLLGEQAIIGATANTFEQIERLYQQKVDYIGLGPFIFTNTKKNLSPTLGLEGYQNILNKMQEQGINIPVIAIGGILLKDIQPIIKTGVYGIAISSLISNNEEPVSMTKKILETINH